MRSNGTHEYYPYTSLNRFRCRVWGVRCRVSGVRRQVSGARCPVSDVRCLVSGVRCGVSGVRCGMSGVRCWVLGQVSGTRRRDSRGGRTEVTAVGTRDPGGRSTDVRLVRPRNRLQTRPLSLRSSSSLWTDRGLGRDTPCTPDTLNTVERSTMGSLRLGRVSPPVRATLWVLPTGPWSVSPASDPVPPTTPTSQNCEDSVPGRTRKWHGLPVRLHRCLRKKGFSQRPWDGVSWCPGLIRDDQVLMCLQS